MKRVLLDVDGVLADFHAPTLSFLEQEFGAKHDLLSFPTWDIFQTVDRALMPAVEERWATQGWCEAIPHPPVGPRMDRRGGGGVRGHDPRRSAVHRVVCRGERGHR